MIYNLYFHPLSHIPGNFWARATGVPSWVAAFSGKRHVWLWEQFQTYGSPIRPEPNTVLFCDPEAYADIYNMKANVRRGRFYEALQSKTEEKTTLTVVDVAEHSRRRKFLNICFSDRMVREACQFVCHHVDRWNEILVQDIAESGEWSTSLNFSHSIDTMVFDVMGDLNFGASFDIKEPGDRPFKEVPQLIAQYMTFYYPVCKIDIFSNSELHSSPFYLSLSFTNVPSLQMCRSPLLSLLLWLKPRGLERVLDIISPPAIRQYLSFLDESVKKRLALEEEQQILSEQKQRKDIFHFLYKATNPSTGLKAYGLQDLISEASLLVVAGSHTTSASLAGIFFYLTADPPRLQKLEREILSKFESLHDIVHGPTLAECTYLRACVDEGMRLTPAGPCEMPREVLKGGIYVKGRYYPKGTIIGTSIWCDSRNEEVYGDPRVFRPERWIVNESEGVSQDDVARAKANFNPFAAGPGHCVGKAFALSEIMITIARTLYRLEVRRTPGSILGGHCCSTGCSGEMQLVDSYITLLEGPEVQFRKRT